MLKIAYITILSLFLFSCGNEEEVKDDTDPSWSNQQSIDMNKRFAFEQEAEIKVYLKRHPELKMDKSESGLRYMLYQDSVGPKIKEDEVAFVNYTINLLDEDTVYQSEPGMPKSFKVDKSDVEMGLHEGIKMLSVGDKAKFILPSHLAHGLLGDMREIPPLEVIVIDLELVAIKN